MCNSLLCSDCTANNLHIGKSTYTILLPVSLWMRSSLTNCYQYKFVVITQHRRDPYSLQFQYLAPFYLKLKTHMEQPRPQFYFDLYMISGIHLRNLLESCHWPWFFNFCFSFYLKVKNICHSYYKREKTFIFSFLFLK